MLIKHLIRVLVSASGGITTWKNLRSIVVRVLRCFFALPTHECTIMRYPSCHLSQKSLPRGARAYAQKSFIVENLKTQSQKDSLRPLVHRMLARTEHFTAVSDVSVAMCDHGEGETRLNSPAESDPGRFSQGA